LSGDTSATRQAAAKELESAGYQVQAAIQGAFKKNITLETRRRLEQIWNAVSAPNSETVRAILAIMVLERIGSHEAETVLQALAQGAAGARESEQEKASLQRPPVDGRDCFHDELGFHSMPGECG
jgi:hypothetical protein